MEWQRLAIRIVLFADFLIFANWVIQYARVNWRSTPVGRHLMALGVVLTVLLGLTFLRSWLGELVYWLWLVGLIALGAVGIQRTLLLFRAQKVSRGLIHPDDRDHDDGSTDPEWTDTMTQPVPTQTKHPWRATVRTVVAASVGLLSLLPLIAVTAHVEAVPAVGQVLAVTGAITRVLAIPGVNTWLHQYKLAAWLAADPPKS